jgi:hypothetical protein
VWLSNGNRGMAQHGPSATTLQTVNPHASTNTSAQFAAGNEARQSNAEDLEDVFT